MTQQRRSLRVGLTAIACSLVLRLFSLGALPCLLDRLTQPRALAFLIYLETGRKVRFSPEDTVPPPVIRTGFPQPELSYPVQSPAPQPPPLPRFTDPDLVDITYLCPYEPDLGALLSQPLAWDLASGAPTVLIFHTHTTESYEKGDLTYQESAPYRTLDQRYNVLSVGDRVTELLEQAGIVTIHDRHFHDYPDYNGCYGRSRRCTQDYLKKYPSLCLILDLHRDANDGRNGQLRTLGLVDGEDSAQLMIVAGSNAAGGSHRHWKENLALALKLQAQLQTQNPGIARPLSFRANRFNQDLSPGSLLIEVGGAGNSHREALLAAQELARAIIALSRGTGDAPVPPEPPAEGPAAP